MKHQLPVEAFYVSQMQIVLLLLAFRADATVIAGFGALMRIAALLGPIRMVNSAFFIPIVAQAKTRVGLKILGFTALIGLPCLILLGLTILWPDMVLALLGEKYAGLRNEVAVMGVATLLSVSSGAFWNLVAHRGWVEFTLFQIPIAAAWVAFCYFFIASRRLQGH